MKKEARSAARATGMDKPIRTYIGIPHTQIEDYLRLGWMVLGPMIGPHGHWSSLGQWLCDCPVRMPGKTGILFRRPTGPHQEARSGAAATGKEL